MHSIAQTTTQQAGEDLPNDKSECSKSSNISKLRELLIGAVESIVEASKIVLTLIDSNRMDLSDISTEAGIPRSLVDSLERVGRNKLCPELVFCDSPGKRALRRLPHDLQEKYLKEPVQVLIFNGATPEPLKVQVDNLTREQACQVFDGKRVRDLSGQRAWLEAFRIRSTVKPVNPLWAVSGKRVHIAAPCNLDLSEVLKIASELSR